jgi:sec-independent protein translocase protein TatB
MFEISWSELLILAIVTLIFVGPKELPVFLRTIGRYAGMVKRQATEFRAQFDAALREAELESVTKEFESMQAAVNAEVMGAKQALNDAAAPPVELPAPDVSAAPPAEFALPMPPMPATPSMER